MLKRNCRGWERAGLANRRYYGTNSDRKFAKERCGTRHQEVSDSLHHCLELPLPEPPQEGHEVLGTRMHGSED